MEMYPTQAIMIRYLKVMYYLGFLPVQWNNGEDPEVGDLKFKISKAKIVLILIFDFILALFSPIYFFLWHWINIDGFDMSLMFAPSYYTELSTGSVTTSLTKLSSIVLASSMFWIFASFGKFKIYLILNC